MNAQPIKVLYIAGYGRSGSTLLGNILGQIDGFFFVSEIHNIWTHIAEDRLCACGQTISRCPVWSEIIATAFGGYPGIDLQQMQALRDRSIPDRHALLRAAPFLRRRSMAQLQPYLVALSRLYSAIREVTGCRVIVDASKRPTYGFLLNQIPAIDLYPLHLVRDARAAAHSWQRRRIQQITQDTQVAMINYSSATSAGRWVRHNITTGRLRDSRTHRRHLLRYEDFVARPVEAINDILRFVNETPAQLPFEGDRHVRLEPNHAIGGNPIRFDSGLVEIRPDDAWIHKMKPADRRIVTLLSWPLLRRYGYPLLPTR